MASSESATPQRPFHSQLRVSCCTINSHLLQLRRLGEEVGAADELVITMLRDGKAVRSVVLGTGLQDGLLSTMKSWTVLVGMSSSSPTGTRELGKELSNAGIAMVDAPVSGGVKRLRPARWR